MATRGILLLARFRAHPFFSFTPFPRSRPLVGLAIRNRPAAPPSWPVTIVQLQTAAAMRVGARRNETARMPFSTEIVDGHECSCLPRRPSSGVQASLFPELFMAELRRKGVPGVDGLGTLRWSKIHDPHPGCKVPGAGSWARTLRPPSYLSHSPSSRLTTLIYLALSFCILRLRHLTSCFSSLDLLSPCPCRDLVSLFVLFTPKLDLFFLPRFFGPFVLRLHLHQPPSPSPTHASSRPSASCPKDQTAVDSPSRSTRWPSVPPLARAFSHVTVTL